MIKTTNKPLLTVLLVSGVLFLGPFQTLAQEGSPGHGLGDINQSDNNYTQGQLPTDGIGEPINEIIAPKEKATAKPEMSTTVVKKKIVKPIVPKKVEANEQTATSDTDNDVSTNVENNESVLGFNVLYYIIQKFKFNDVNVIDQ